MNISSLNKIKLFFTVLIISNINIVSGRKGIIQQPPEPICDQLLLNAYGLTGNPVPKLMLVEMCPGIQLSCCTKEDQLKFYGRWIEQKEQARVGAHYMRTMKIYELAMKLFRSSTKLAKKIEKFKRLQKVGNCKLMAERLISYEVPDYMAEILVEFKSKMQAFFNQTYSGFYCSLCNAENHPFINNLTKKIIFSQTFCRNIIENTLPSQLYFHLHLVKISNLVGQFLASCSFRGKFNRTAVPPKNTRMSLPAETEKHLVNCKTYRNDKNWFRYCKPICEKFAFVKYPKWFDGQIKALTKLIKFGKSRLKAIARDAVKNPIIANPIPKRRVLAAKSKLVKGLDNIFPPSIGAKVFLQDYKAEFLTYGISLYEQGRNSIIKKIMFDQVSTLLNLEKASTHGESTVNTIKNMSTKNSLDEIHGKAPGANYQSHTLISQTLLILVVLFVF